MKKQLNGTIDFDHCLDVVNKTNYKEGNMMCKEVIKQGLYVQEQYYDDMFI